MPLSSLSFETSAPTTAHLPEDAGLEVCFAGRSNAGKSSAINTIFNQRGLAKVSKQPGRTQAFNVFGMDETRRVVDLPGYGYAKVPESVQRRWEHEIPAYFAERESLVGVVLIMDIRHPFKETDTAFLSLAAHLPMLVLLSKADKLARGQQQKQLAMARRAGAPFQLSPDQLVPFSATSRQGLESVQRVLEDWFTLAPARPPVDDLPER